MANDIEGDLLMDDRQLQEWIDDGVCTIGDLGRAWDLGLLRMNIHKIVGWEKMMGLGSLTLEGNNLSVIPEEIGLMIGLRYLVICSNRIAELPAEIGLLVALEHLDVSDNELTTLPKELGSLDNLRTLRTFGNPMQHIHINCMMTRACFNHYPELYIHTGLFRQEFDLDIMRYQQVIPESWLWVDVHVDIQ